MLRCLQGFHNTKLFEIDFTWILDEHEICSLGDSTRNVRFCSFGGEYRNRPTNIMDDHKNTRTRDIGWHRNLDLIDRLIEIDVATLESLALGGIDLGIASVGETALVHPTTSPPTT